MIKVLSITLVIIFVGSIELALADRYSDCDQLEKPDRTIRSCTQFLKRGKKETRKARSSAYNSRGLAYAIKSQQNRAIEDINKAIQLDPKFADAYNSRGIVYHSKGQHDRAIEDYNKAIQLDPKFAEAYNNRGSAYSKKGHQDSAIVDFSKAIQLKPKYAAAYYNRGLTLYSMVDYDSAIEDFSKAIQLNPKYTAAYSYRALIHHKRQEKDKAIADWRKILEIDPNNDAARNALNTLKLGIPPLTQVYSNSDQGWMIVYPDGWIVDDSDPSYVKISPRGRLALVGIHTKKIRYSKLEDVVEFFIDFRRNYSENSRGISYKVLKREQGRFGDGTRFVKVYDRMGDDRGGKSLILMTLVGSTAYSVVAESHTANWPDLVGGFERIVQSFTLIK